MRRDGLLARQAAGAARSKILDRLRLPLPAAAEQTLGSRKFSHRIGGHFKRILDGAFPT
jgi:hypothetical protein